MGTIGCGQAYGEAAAFRQFKRQSEHGARLVVGPGEYWPGAKEALSLYFHLGLARGFCIPIRFDEMVVPPGHTSLVPGRRGREGSLRLARLIPICYAAEEIGPLDIKTIFRLIAVAAVFDGDLERFGKMHRIEQMPSVANAAVAGLIALPAGLAEPGAGSSSKSPRIVEVVFAACPLQTGHLLAIDVEEIVAFAEPAALPQRHGHYRSHIVSATS